MLKAGIACNWVADVEFIIQEAVRFSTILPWEIEDRWDALSELPHPTNKRQKIICGRKAIQRLWRIAEKFVETHPLGPRIDTSKVVDNLSYQIMNRFVAKAQTIDTSNVQSALASAVKRSATHCSDITHYIPCHIAEDREVGAFSIGPVAFAATDDVLEHINPYFEDYISSFQKNRDDRDAATKEGRYFVDAATAYFQNFG